MIFNFSGVGIVEEILDRHTNACGDSIAFTILSNADDRFHLIATGKVLAVVEEKLRKGDLIYVDGRCRADRNLKVQVPKNVVVYFVNYLTILPRGNS